jgi:hypothetical protein
MGLLVPRVKNGFGRHNRYVPAENRKTATRLLVIAQLMWALALAMCKMSVAILLLRLKQGKRWKIFLYSLVSLILTATVVTYISAFFQCRPIAALWDATIPGARCWMPKYVQARFFTVNIYVIVTDVIFSFLPVTFIRQLNRPLREKIVLYFLMGLALFGSAASILKTIQANNFTKKDDSLWVGVDITMWCFVEQQLGIIAGCLPYLKSTFERALTRFGLLPSLPTTTPSFVVGYEDHSHETFGMHTLSRKWQQYMRHEGVNDGKSEGIILPLKEAESTSQEFLKMPDASTSPCQDTGNVGTVTT